MDSGRAGYESQLRTVFEAECDRLDLNLMVVVGRPFEAGDPAGRAQNAIYQLMHQDCVDGLILVSSALASSSGAESISRLQKMLPNLPTCSIGLRVPDMPSVSVDNRTGMSNLMDHLLTVHRRRAIAYVGGPLKNPDAVARREVYEQALTEHGITIDSRLIASGDFTRATGVEAMNGILKSGAPFDAVVSANDNMALGVIDVLNDRGYRVPRDVAVTGFDDALLSRYAPVPLTTVRQPLAQMAAAAIASVHRQLMGKSVDDDQHLVAQFVQRESCGCTRRQAARIVRSLPPMLSPPQLVKRRARQLERQLSMEIALPAPDGWARRLVQSLELELEGPDEFFATALDDLLNKIGRHDEVYDDFQLMISMLREELADLGDMKLEELWHSARRQIALASIRNQTAQRMEADDEYQRLLRTGERFSSALDHESLSRALAEELPRLNAKDLFISLYADEARTELVPFFWMRNGVAQSVPDVRFPATKLIHDSTFWQERRRTAFAFPLTFESEQLGVAVFGEGTGVYEMLREQISAALKVNLLHREIVRKTTLHERSVQERLATAERMQSLSVLAGGVAHDLNNALGPLVGLPDILQQDVKAVAGGDQERAARVRSDLNMIKMAALRASQTIKDLLTLGRQGQGTREPLELNQVVQQCIASEPLKRRAEESRVALTMNLCHDRLGLLGSEPHLVRAISNLLRNGMEAVGTSGGVSLQTSRAMVAEPLAGYETVEVGDYCVVTVSDTGTGMAPGEIARAFEPFFTKKRYGGQSGSGLGLAIVHAVVKEHGGFIHVESLVGVGTTFTLYFPVIEMLAAARDERSEPSRGSGRLLIVDDEPIQLLTAERALTELGYEVVSVSSGERAYLMIEAALTAPTERPFDLVICDMVLGEQEDGVDLLSRVKQRYPRQRGMIVSGHASTERSQAAAQMGVPWLAKPYTADALAEAVAAVLDAGRDG
jgi:DNA-binding LacI/PurR family transcriptional regulator/C4-dicarboxylate-specific signal transduction histidine kinase/ActR/RegA family two-component response regulator